MLDNRGTHWRMAADLRNETIIVRGAVPLVEVVSKSSSGPQYIAADSF